MFTPRDLVLRADQCLQRRNEVRQGVLGGGKDGIVWRTSRATALKVHQRRESYENERDAYIRFRDRHITTVAGMSIPRMLDFDDGLLAIGMQIVFPPFIVDFASAQLDDPLDLIQDEGNTLEDLVRERFGELADEAMAIYYELAARADVYVLDLHPHNIKFANQ